MSRNVIGDAIERDVRIDDIRFLREAGETEWRIARRLGLTWETYEQFVRRYVPEKVT